MMLVILSDSKYFVLNHKDMPLACPYTKVRQIIESPLLTTHHSSYYRVQQLCICTITRIHMPDIHDLVSITDPYECAVGEVIDIDMDAATDVSVWCTKNTLETGKAHIS